MKTPQKILKVLEKRYFVHVLKISGKGFFVNKYFVHSCASRYHHDVTGCSGLDVLHDQELPN